MTHDSAEGISLLTADGHTLAGDLRAPAGALAGAVICHPHPAYGGDRHNPVVDALYRGLSAAGVAVLAFVLRRAGAADRTAVLGLGVRDLQAIGIDASVHYESFARYTQDYVSGNFQSACAVRGLFADPDVAAYFGAGGIISLGSLVGFFTVLGIVALNGIMLISHYQHLENEEGRPFGVDLILRASPLAVGYEVAVPAYSARQGAATITADPGADSPVITANGASARDHPSQDHRLPHRVGVHPGVGRAP